MELHIIYADDDESEVFVNEPDEQALREHMRRVKPDRGIYLCLEGTKGFLEIESGKDRTVIECLMEAGEKTYLMVQSFESISWLEEMLVAWYSEDADFIEKYGFKEVIFSDIPEKKTVSPEEYKVWKEHYDGRKHIAAFQRKVKLRIGAVLLLVLFVFLAVKVIRTNNATDIWIPVQGTVLKTSYIKADAEKDLITEYLVYSYRVGGKKYTGIYEHEVTDKALPKGSTLKVMFQEAHPEKSRVVSKE